MKKFGISIILTICWLFNLVANEDVLKKQLLQSSNKFVALCYHDLPKNVDLDKYGVDSKSFINQIEYLKGNGYNFIGLNDIIKAKKGEQPLPENAILMTFDDAYISQYKHVYKILKLYKIPWVLAVVGQWIDHGPPKEAAKTYQKKFMTWDQIKELAKDPNVEVACHSYNMHYAVQINPQGSTAPAIISRIYDPQTGTYEDDETYRKRLYNDFKKGYDSLKEKTGIDPRVIVWPYGKYNQISIEEAKKAGFSISFTLDDGLGKVDKLEAVPRYMITDNPKISLFVKDFSQGFKFPERKKIIHADLDLLYHENQEQMNKNIDKFIQRIYKLRPTTVYLQAFCDSDGDGNVSSVYFPNTVLPMKADIFSRVARSLIIRNIEVYAWMPMLSFITPDQGKNIKFSVHQGTGGDDDTKPTTYSYKRLSPFNKEACEIISNIYRDLAINAYIDGVVFQDDGYLNDFEDFSEEAMDDYLEITGGEKIPFKKLPNEIKNKWTDLKTEKLIELTDKLKKTVSYYRPQAFYSRIIYAPVMTDVSTEEWFAQNYDRCLDSYDYVTVMAYPRMEGVYFSNSWLEKLVSIAKKKKEGIKKTVFKIQTYDWKKNQWIDSETLAGWLKTLVKTGAHNIAYYPDNLYEDQPRLSIIVDEISSEIFPYEKQGE